MVVQDVVHQQYVDNASITLRPKDTQSHFGDDLGYFHS